MSRSMHEKTYLNGKKTVLPTQGELELKKATIEGIKKRLGIEFEAEYDIPLVEIGTIRFPVLLTQMEEGGYVVTFPDVPEAITQGENREEALVVALDALIVSFDFYREDRRPMPLPSYWPQWRDYIELPLCEAEAIRTYNTELKQTKPSEGISRFNGHIVGADGLLH